MKLHNLKNIDVNTTKDLIRRPSINFEKAFNIVRPILDEIKEKGIQSVVKYAEKFDNFSSDSVLVSEEEFEEAEKKVPNKVKDAIGMAYENITIFHQQQFPENYSLETRKGVKCSREYRPIENIGLYIPGGTAILPSTMLMLGIPAKIAGCKRIICCSPASREIHPVVLYAAGLCGIKEFYKIGGAQSIAMMAYGTEINSKVDKIFGPGNQYVTAAKTLVSIDPEGCQIDMPAGPSEVLVIADENANPVYVASDLLSQAEHGIDSQVVLVTDSTNLANDVLYELKVQLKQLKRRKIAEQALEKSLIIVVDKIEDAIRFSNLYAPEHLILNFNRAESSIEKIVNAGSVFIGPFSPESAGDYASGTNHSLPTYGYARSVGGVSVEMFMKAVTFQKLTKQGLANIADSIIDLAEVENLDAHANAVKMRLK